MGPGARSGSSSGASRASKRPDGPRNSGISRARPGASIFHNGTGLRVGSRISRTIEESGNLLVNTQGTYDIVPDLTHVGLRLLVEPSRLIWEIREVRERPQSEA